jgi:hypothetical protein
MGNYTYNWTDLRPGTITVNSGRGGLYASYFTGGYYLSAGIYGTLRLFAMPATWLPGRHAIA